MQDAEELDFLFVLIILLSSQHMVYVIVMKKINSRYKNS